MRDLTKKCACGRPAILLRRYEGRYYCDRCLSKQIEKSFKKTTGKNHLIKKNDKICIALSGGKDSSSLLYLFWKVFRQRRDLKIFALIIDEGIGNYRKECIKEAEKLCKKLGIKLYKTSFKKELGITIDKVAKKTSKTCTYCGVFKRYLLNKKARELGATKLAVAHNLDDEAQAIIMNVIRCDLKRFERLGPIPGVIRDKKFVPRIKPLRQIHEKELYLYAATNSLPFCSKECPYSHDNVRRDVRKLINDLEEKYPGTKIQIVKFYDAIIKKLAIQKKGKLGHCKKCGEPTNQEICKACELLERLKNTKKD